MYRFLIHLRRMELFVITPAKTRAKSIVLPRTMVVMLRRILAQLDWQTNAKFRLRMPSVLLNLSVSLLIRLERAKYLMKKLLNSSRKSLISDQNKSLTSYSFDVLSTRKLLPTVTLVVTTLISRGRKRTRLSC